MTLLGMNRRRLLSAFSANSSSHLHQLIPSSSVTDPFSAYSTSLTANPIQRLHEVISSLNHMPRMNPPPLIQFTKLLSVLVRMGHFHTVLSFSNRMDFRGISPDVYTGNILMNCFCRLRRVDFGFSVFGRMFKLGLQPDIITFNTLINGLSKQANLVEVVNCFDKIVALGYQPTVNTYNVIVNSLSKMGKFSVTFGLLETMVQTGYESDVVTYNSIIDSLCKYAQVNEALHLFSKIKSDGILPNFVTYTSLIHGLCYSDQWRNASKLFNEKLLHRLQKELLLASGISQMLKAAFPVKSTVW